MHMATVLVMMIIRLVGGDEYMYFFLGTCVLLSYTGSFSTKKKSRMYTVDDKLRLKSEYLKTETGATYLTLFPLVALSAKNLYTAQRSGKVFIGKYKCKIRHMCKIRHGRKPFSTKKTCETKS